MRLHSPKLLPAPLNWFLRLDASYHRKLTPMFMRGAMTYHKSHSRRSIRSRRKLLPPVSPGQDLILSPQDISTRSKCVPINTDPVSVAEPVKKPFGLQA